MLDRESLNRPPSAKIGPTEGVGCMAVLGCTLVLCLANAFLVSLFSLRTIGLERKSKCW